MTRRSRLSMTARLLIAFAVLLFPLVLFSAWSYQQSLDERRDLEMDDAANTAETMAAIVSGVLGDLESTLLAMSLALGQENVALDQATVGPYLAAVSTNDPIVLAIFLMDPEGRVIVAPQGVGRDLRDRPYTQALLGGQEFVLSDVAQGLESGTPTVAMGRTVRGSDGELRGLLVIAFYPDRLAELFPRALPEDAILTVLDRRGVAVYSSVSPEMAWEERDQSAAPGVQEALAGRVVTEPNVVTTADGEERLVAAVPVPRFGWVVSYSRAASTIEGPLLSLFRRQVLALGAVSLGALLVAMVVSHSLTRSLRRLSDHARAFGHGDRDRPAPLTGPAEVQTLAGAFNQMAAEIDARFAERETAEARYRGIFEHAMEGIFQTGFDGRFRTVNTAGARMLGYDSPEALIAAVPDVRQLYVDPSRLEDYIAEMRAHGEVVNFEFEARRRDGSTCWLQLNARASTDGDGGIDLVEGLVSDITDRKRAEQEREDLLSREQAARAEAEHIAGRIARLQDVTASLSEALTPEAVMEVIAGQGVAALGAYAGGVGLCSADGQMIEVVRAVGYTSEVMARAQRYPVTADNPPAEAVRTGVPVWAEDVAQEGARFPRHAAAAVDGSGSRAIAAIPLLEDGVVIGALAFSFREAQSFSLDDRAFMVALARQCSQALSRARLFEAEQHARAEAEAANRAKDEFLSTLSHELRTPLTPILGWAGMLRRRSLDEEGRERALEIIERSARAQVQLVSDLLDVSRIVTGKLQIELRPVDLNDVVAAAIGVIQPAADAKSIGMEVRIDPAIGPVEGDPDRLQQVVWNLLSNAVKFTPDGGRIEVALERADDAVQLTIGDTGEGVDATFLPYVFDRFRQADSTSTRRFGGLGLGLAIVRYLVELHGGTVSATSAGTGRGATFAVRLPLAAPGTVDVGDDTDGTALRPGALSGMRVLVVDDEADTRAFLRALFESEGATVRAAASSAEALAAVAAGRPDVIVADIAMPDEDGYRFIERVRARPEAAGGATPAVALTAYAGAADRGRALAAGFQDHLAKPVEPRALLEALVRLAGQTAVAD